MQNEPNVQPDEPGQKTPPNRPGELQKSTSANGWLIVAGVLLLIVLLAFVLKG